MSKVFYEQHLGVAHLGNTTLQVDCRLNYAQTEGAYVAIDINVMALN